MSVGGGARYSSVAIVLHWAIAILILGQIAGGLYMHGLPSTSPAKFTLFQLHKSFGLSVLALSLFRLGWRFTHRPPALPTAMPNWQKLAARATHWGFYALMILTPLAGWAIVSVSPTEIPTKWFGIIPIPHLPFFDGVADRKGVEDILKERHEMLAFMILGLLVLHVGAAMKHLFINEDGVVASMIPPRKRHWMGVGAIFAVLLAGAAFYVVAPQAQGDPAKRVVPSHSHDHDDDHGEGQNVGDAAAWIIDDAASRLSFTGTEKGKRFEGEFSQFSADIIFDPDDLSEARINVTISTASAATGSELRDATMPGSEWFGVKEYPTATFTSRSVRAVADGYEADGMLHIKEFERPITLDFTLEIDGDKAVAVGGVDLLRTDFGLGTNASWLDEEAVALEAWVQFEIHAMRGN